MKGLIVCWIVMEILISVKVNGLYSNDADHECTRICKWPPEPRTCRYTFTVEWLQTMSAACYDCPINMTDCDRPGCIPLNGVRRPIVTVNRQLPGPPIQVCEDDNLEVKVWNRLGNSEGTTIHWHGIHQRGTPYMDGPSMITQCPISPQASFTYKFKASPAGTSWWHSHSNLQRQDGAFGALIVKQAPDRDVNSELYDYDLAEHVVFVQDWLHEPTIARSAAFPPLASGSDTLVINGKGVFQEFGNNNNEAIYTPREVFSVKHGGRYRFRVIGNNICHMIISVQAHNLTVIATDGAPVKPLVVDRIGLTSGERFDFVLTTDRNVGNYWFRLSTTDPACPRVVKEEFAILRYEGPSDEEPQDAFFGVQDDRLFLNAQSLLETPNGIDVVDMEAAVPDDERLLGEPDARHYMAVGINTVSRWNMYAPEDYPNPQVSEFRRATRQLNYVSFKVPPSPLLTQLDDIAQEEFCNADERLDFRDECLEKYCTCIETIKIELGQVVELVLVGEDFFGADHPMHIHGYSFRVVGIGKLARGTTVADVIELDRAGNITRTLQNAVIKDSVPVQGDGYTIIRFVADNPGWWLFHCHKIFHVADGMTVALQVGEPSDLPPVPANFPRCGSWSSVRDEYDSNGKERKHGPTEDNPDKSRKVSIIDSD